MPSADDGSGLIFAFLSGSIAYIVAFVLLGPRASHAHIAFAQGTIFPYSAPVWAAWLSVLAAAAWQYFVVRRQLRKSESDKARYQQAIHFVTHEMRSPLTAIQGSSELMGRYNLNDDKAQADGADDQLRVEAAGADDSDLSGYRASDGRTDGNPIRESF